MLGLVAQVSGCLCGAKEAGRGGGRERVSLGVWGENMPAVSLAKRVAKSLGKTMGYHGGCPSISRKTELAVQLSVDTGMVLKSQSGLTES